MFRLSEWHARAYFPRKRIYTSSTLRGQHKGPFLLLWPDTLERLPEVERRNARTLRTFVRVPSALLDRSWSNVLFLSRPMTALRSHSRRCVARQRRGLNHSSAPLMNCRIGRSFRSDTGCLHDSHIRRQSRFAGFNQLMSSR